MFTQTKKKSLVLILTAICCVVLCTCIGVSSLTAEPQTTYAATAPIEPTDNTASWMQQAETSYNAGSFVGLKKNQSGGNEWSVTETEDGTVLKPYLIENELDFALMLYETRYAVGALSSANKYFELTADLDMKAYYLMNSSMGYSPTSSSPVFGGIFDGKEKTVKNVFIKSLNGSSNASIFNSVSGIIRNLKIENAVVYSSAAPNTAVIASSLYAGATISDVTVKNSTVTCENEGFMGGIVGASNIDSSSGNNTTAIRNCKVENSVIRGINYVGGIIGYQDSQNTSAGTAAFEVVSCLSRNNTISATSFAGGIAGRVRGSYLSASNQVSVNIEKCYNSSAVSATRASGGIVGGVSQHSVSWEPCVSSTQFLIIECGNSGDVTAVASNSYGGTYAGGICGLIYAEDSYNLRNIEHSFNWGTISAEVGANEPYIAGNTDQDEYSPLPSNTTRGYIVSGITARAKRANDDGYTYPNHQVANINDCYNAGQLILPNGVVGLKIGVANTGADSEEDVGNYTLTPEAVDPAKVYTSSPSSLHCTQEELLAITMHTAYYSKPSTGYVILKDIPRGWYEGVFDLTEASIIIDNDTASTVRVSRDGGTTYETGLNPSSIIILASAATANTVTVTADVATDITLTIEETIESSAATLITNNSNNALTITGTAASAVTMGAACTFVKNLGNGALNLDTITVSGTTGDMLINGASGVTSTGSVNISSGSYTNTYAGETEDSNSSGNNHFYAGRIILNYAGALNISGGTLSTKTTFTKYLTNGTNFHRKYFATIYNYNDGKITISGGTVTDESNSHDYQQEYSVGGTIFLNKGNSSYNVLEITAGTVENVCNITSIRATDSSYNTSYRYGSSAINALVTASNIKVLVQGELVQGKGYVPVVQHVDLTVSDGIVQNTGRGGVYYGRGNVTITGGEVRTTATGNSNDTNASNVIEHTSPTGKTVTVKDSGKVTATDMAKAIHSSGYVVIGDKNNKGVGTAMVTSATNEAIHCFGDSNWCSVSVYGGTVSSGYSNTPHSTIRYTNTKWDMDNIVVDGGTVTATNGYALYSGSVSTSTQKYIKVISGTVSTEKGVAIKVDGASSGNKNNVVISGGEVKATDGGTAIVIDDCYTLTISNGAVTSNGSNTVKVNYTTQTSQNTTTFSGGTITNTNATNGIAVNISDYYYIVNIIGGTISCNNGNAIYLKSIGTESWFKMGATPSVGTVEFEGQADIRAKSAVNYTTTYYTGEQLNLILTGIPSNTVLVSDMNTADKTVYFKLDASMTNGVLQRSADKTKMTYLVTADVTHTLTNLTASPDDTVTVYLNLPYSTTLSAATDYLLPDSIAITVGGTTLVAANYTYTKSTGEVAIAAAYVTGDIVIAADGVAHTHDLQHVEASPAGPETDGNIEYWYCEGCDKYFSDENAANQITQASTVIAATGYTVTFSGGSDATGTAPTESNKARNATFALPANTFEKTGHTFSKWSDGTNEYAAGESYTMPASNVTFTAVWTESSYKITYDWGLVEDNEQDDVYLNVDIVMPASHIYGTATVIPNPVRTGYTFNGWKINGGTLVPETDDGLSLAADGYTANITLEADWTAWTQIEYRIVRYVQNINDDNYTANYYYHLYGVQGTTTNYSYTPGEGFVLNGSITQLKIDNAQNSADRKVIVTGIDRRYWTVTFAIDANKATSTDTLIHTVKHETPIEGLIPDVTPKAGYEFVQANKIWDDWIINDSSKKAASNVTYTAQLRAVSYNIEYSLNGGALAQGVTNPENYTIESATFTLSKPSKTGYDFAGWTFEGQTMPITSVTIENGTTGAYSFTANWTPKDYNVTFNANGGTGSIENQSISFGTSEKLTAIGTNIVKEGHSFAGWATTDKGDVAYADGASYTMETEGATLFAVWNFAKYNIGYQGTDGIKNASALPTKHTYNTPTIVPDATKTGYTFDGWQVNGGTATKDLTLSATAYTDDITLTATWTVNKHSVKVTSGAKSDITLWEGDVKKVVSYMNSWSNSADDLAYGTELTLEFKAVIGYGTGVLIYKTGDETKTGIVTLSADNKFNMPDCDLTIEVIYKPIKYTVHYTVYPNFVDDPTLTGTMDDQEFEFGVEEQLTPPAYTTDIYYVRMWYKDYITPSGPVPLDFKLSNLANTDGAVVTLYGQFIPKSVTVTYDNNGGRGTMNIATYNCNSVDAPEYNVFTKTGYHFVKWSTTTTETAETEYMQEGVYAANDEKGYMWLKYCPELKNNTMTLYAVWEPNAYKVAFNGNGSTGGSIGRQTLTYDAEATALTANAFTKTGFIFAGWNTEADGTGTDYTDKQSVQNLTAVNNATVTLYAKWTECNHSGNTTPLSCTESTVCSVCGGSVGARGHNYGAAWVSNGDGTHSHVCSYDSAHKSEPQSCHGGTANCMQKATCDDCNEVYGAFGNHAYGAWEKHNATQHKRICSINGEHIDYADHTWDNGEVTIPATHIAEGEKTFTCTECNETKTEDIVKLTAHTYNKEVADASYLKSAATCSSPAIYYKSCECGEAGTETFEYGEALSHDYTGQWHSDVNGHWKVCLVGSEKGEEYAHTPDRTEPTETEPVKCSVCQYVITPATGHITHTPNTSTWYSDGTNHWHKCEGCEEKLDINAHIGGTATCQDKAVCSVCGTSYGDLTDHNYGDWTSYNEAQHKRECSICQEVEYANHTWDNGEITANPTHTVPGEKTFTCTVCGKTKTEPVSALTEHSYTQEVATETYLKTPASCTSRAVYYKSCICGERGTETFEHGEMLAHTPTAIPEKAATCTEKGHTEGSKCSVCDTILTATTETDALGHDFVFTRTVAPNLENQTDGYDLYTCSHDDTHTEQRNIVEWETLIPKVTVTVSGGTIEGKNGNTITVNKDGSVTVLADVSVEGKVFKGWMSGDTIISTSQTYTFTATETLALTAVYEDAPKEGLTGGAIAGIAVGGTALAGFGGFALFWFVIKKKKFADLLAIFKKK